MKFIMLVLAPVFFVSLVGLGRAGDGDAPAGRLMRFDLSKKPLRPRNPRDVIKGDLLEFFAVSSTERKELTLKTLKVDITGDAIEMVGIVQIIGILAGESNERIDKTKRNLSCFLKVAKKGKATVKITPMLENGKLLAPYELRFVVSSEDVLKTNPPAK